MVNPLSHAGMYVLPPSPDNEKQWPLEPLERHMPLEGHASCYMAPPEAVPLLGALHFTGPHPHEAHDRDLHGSRHSQPWRDGGTG